MDTSTLATAPAATAAAPAPAVLVLGSPRWAGAPLAPAALAQRVAAAGSMEALARLAASIQGDWAFALREPSGRIVAATDRFAQQTLCWRADAAEGVVLAERADALAAGAPGGGTIDPQALFDYAWFHAIPSPRTVFAGVQRVPPGHLLVHERGRTSVQRWWQPHFAPVAAPSFDALRGAFRAHLEAAVRTRLEGAGVPACFLSGGTDSSTVAGLVTKLAGRPASTWSIGFDAGGYDEMAYARLAAKHFGTEHHEYYVTPADLVASIERVAASHDQPFGNSSAVPTYWCAAKAKEAGVTRLLAGDGGDELFGGNSRYAKQRVFGWYGAVPPALRRGAVEPLASLFAGVPLLKKAQSYVEQARVPLPDRHDLYNLLGRIGPAEVFTPAFLAAVDTTAPSAQQRAVWAHTTASTGIDRMLAYDWRYTLAENDLPKVRGSTRLAGVEVAYPFLDDAVADFSLTLPPAYKLKGLKLRWFFKEALRGFLPDEILAKKKHGFGLPFGVWAVQHAGLAALARDAVQGAAARGLVRPAFAARLLAELMPAHPGYYGELVWILATLEFWLRRHAPGFQLR
jgi:asparagine synthase (glutamine-hydrolysing)